MASKRANRIINSIKSKPIKMPSATPLGSPGYDNPRDDIEKVKNLREGTIEKTPVDDLDIANKAYVDAASPSHTESSTDSLTNKTINSETNDVHADDVHTFVRNVSGSTITKGQLVYISGYNAGLDLPQVDLSDATISASAMPVAGMVAEDGIDNNASGHMIEIGRVDGIDTNSHEVGDVIYASETPGAFSTKPTGLAFVEPIGVILRKHASLGEIELFDSGHVTELPNIPDTKIWIGDSNGVPQEFALSGDVAMTAGGVTTVTSSAITANTTHRSSDGTDHADVVTNTSGIATNVTAIGLNTTHTASDGSDHSIVVANQTHAADSTQAHSDYLLNSGADVAVGPLTTTADNSTADLAYLAMVLYNTDATPPAASGFPIGTIYIQYTA